MPLSEQELKELEKIEKASKEKSAVTIPDGYVKVDGGCPTCGDAKHILVQPYTVAVDENGKVSKVASGAITCQSCGSHWAASSIEVKKVKKAVV